MGRPDDTETVEEAARIGNELRLKELLSEEGFNILETYTLREWNLLHFAMSGGHIKCIDAVLEEAGSMKEQLLTQKDALGFVPFRLALQKGYVEVVLHMEQLKLHEFK